jgi:hypothetical protein
MRNLSATFLIITFVLNFLITSNAFSRKIDLGLLKEACTETGLQAGTEDHADCVMRLYKREDLVLYQRPKSYEDTLEIYDPWADTRALLEQKRREREARQTNSNNDLDALLTIGIIIGGAYLLGTALTPAPTPPPPTTTNIFTIINNTPTMLVVPQ